MANTNTLHDNLFAPDVISDPYSYFGQLRAEDPVHWNETYKLWLVTRYDDANWVTKHPEIFSNAVFQRDPRGPYPPVDESHLGLYQFLKNFFASWLAEVDPPEHTEMRKVIYEYFTPKAVERWRPLVRDTIESLLDKVQVGSEGAMDLLEDFAMPLPVFIIGRILGIPEKDQDLVRTLSQKILLYNRGEADRMPELVEAIQTFQGYLEPLVTERISRPGDDLLSVLAGGEKAGVFSREQVIANAILLLFAGHETSMNLTCNGMLAFIRNPRQWELFKQDPASTVKSVTEECLRFDPPVKSIQRIATQDVVLRKKTIKRDDRIRYVISSANRDPDKFEEPDRFDINRQGNHHIAFGAGNHYCVGSTLGRLEGQEAFLALARRFDRFKLDGQEPEYVPGIAFRSILKLPVRWETART